MDILDHNFFPLPGYVLVQPLDDNETLKGTSGSFKFADTTEDKESIKFGTVLAIGGEMVTEYGAKHSCPPEVQKNSLVAYQKWGASDIKYKDLDLVAVKFNNLVGVINGSK